MAMAEAALDALILAEDRGYRAPLPNAPIVTRGKPVQVKRYMLTMPWNQDTAMKLCLCPRLEAIRKANRKRK